MIKVKVDRIVKPLDGYWSNVMEDKTLEQLTSGTELKGNTEKHFTIQLWNLQWISQYREAF